MEQEPIIFPNHTAFFPEVAAAVVIKDSKGIFETPDSSPLDINLPDKKDATAKVVPWGENNDLPQQIIDKVEKSPDLSTGLLFNIQVGYGDGIIACKYEIDDKGVKNIVPVWDNKEINQFFEDNDINGYLLEQLTDINYFFNVFPEIILNSEGEPKVIEISSKEAAFSRWSEMNSKGVIEYHFYSAKWAEGMPSEEEFEYTHVLNAKRPLKDLQERIKQENFPGRFIVPVSFPTPGRAYYQKPFWHSIIASGWYDFAVAIPEFKKYLLQNGMSIRYVIYLSDDYFPDIFTRENITKPDKQKARVALEYENLNKYIAGIENAGKTLVSFYKNSPDGTKKYRIEITTVSNELKGGEYLNDSSEVSNMIAYTLGVHPSLIGASPGKSSSMSGTDKRELFIIKQALLKPIRERLLRPLYLIKKINKWPEEIQFAIPNIELTTLDKEKTGVQTKIS